MANRHEIYKARGGAATKAEVTAGNKDVVEEAKSSKVKRNVPNRKYGGEVGKVIGKASGGRLDRKRGGSVMSSAGGGSADKSPFACAAKGPR